MTTTTSKSSERFTNGWDGFNANGPQGVVSFWIKPSYRPELASKIRNLWDFSRFHGLPSSASPASYTHPASNTCRVGSLMPAKSPFGVWYLPMNGASGSAGGLAQAPRSLLFASSIPPDDTLQTNPDIRMYMGFGWYSPRANHLGWSSEGAQESPFRANAWMHVAVAWRLVDEFRDGGFEEGETRTRTERRSRGSGGSGGGGRGGGRFPGGFTPDFNAGPAEPDMRATQNAALFINGRKAGGQFIGSDEGKWILWYHDPVFVRRVITNTTETQSDDPSTPEVESGTVKKKTDTLTIRGIYANTMRLGNPSQVCYKEGPLQSRGDFSADATFDELYAWDTYDAGVGKVPAIWKRGRYSPQALASGDAWVSPALVFAAGPMRQLPAPSGATPSGASVPPAPGAIARADSVVIHGVSFTWYGEETIAQGSGSGAVLKRVVWDHAGSPVSPSALSGGVRVFGPRYPRPNRRLEPVCEVSLLAGDRVVGVCSDDGFSPVEYAFDPSATAVRYAVRFRLAGTGASPAGAILLGTPVFDDVTIYWSRPSSPLFLEYQAVMMR